jgi:isocitrate/isopropylmalate dehydrogenase
MNKPTNIVKVAVVGGEGIGPEVTAQSQRVLNWFAVLSALDRVAGREREHA